jgi:alpha-L-fucosidase
MNKERAELLRPLLALKPGIITNNRLGGGYKGDSDTPEQHVPATGIKDRDWEVCMTMNHTWGYKDYDDDWKSTEDLLHKLIDITSKGGNFLLNVGPKPDGTIPQASIDRLAGVGDWMELNSESIYGTSASPFRRPWWGRCTKKELDNGDTRLYLQVFHWPEDQKLVIPVNNEAVTCYALAGSQQKYETEQTEDGILVKLSGEAPDEVSSVVILDIKGSPLVPNQNLTLDENGMILLSPETGDLENRGYVSSNHARLIREKEFSYITWKETRTWLEWPVELPGEQSFDVYAQVATASPDNQIIFEVDTVGYKFQLPDTEGLGNFTLVRLGEIMLPGGTVMLTVKGEKENWQECYLGNIELRPAD